MNSLLVDIALPLPLDHTFTYSVPPDLQEIVGLGKRVLVPFGKKHVTGVIVGMPAEAQVRGLRPIADVLDAAPTFPSEMMALTKWMADYYLAPWGEVLRAATPQGFSQESKKVIRCIAPDVETLLPSLKKSAPRQCAILQALAKGEALKLSHLQKHIRMKSVHAVLNAMRERGWISIEEELERPAARPVTKRFVMPALEPAGNNDAKPLTARQYALVEALRAAIGVSVDAVELQPFLKQHHASLSSFQTLEKKGRIRIVERQVFRQSTYDSLEPPPSLTLNTHQQHALDTIAAGVDREAYHAFLLHGITGSGKTQVYIEAIRRVLAKGKSAIVLVPEISLTPQTVRRFKAHFGADVAVMHSQMSVGERYDAWRMAHEGTVHIVIGPRSAVFAPLRRVGLIVVDEEHDGSYKQFDALPRYNARDVALVRASQSNAVAILGSATPSVESYANALDGKYTLLELPERVDVAQLPRIEVVDMAKERRKIYDDIKTDVQKSGMPFPKRLPPSSISPTLRAQISLRLERKEGTILLQNRRGYSHVLECPECGYVEKCSNCDISLTFHATRKHLRCHYCGLVKKAPAACPQCKSNELLMHAFGTQQVQEELQLLFPRARILRMDRDTTTRKGSHDKILQQFGAGDADILLGTQMVAKGLDFPRVTLVGVISADTQMLLPDFRASEGTFQLLTQVSGRAGRSTLAGQVIIQTLQPDHYSLKYAAAHDFHGFYREELKYRHELNYPPFSRIALMEFSGTSQEEVEAHAKYFARAMTAANTRQAFILLGPAEAAIPKINNVYRMHCVAKGLKTADPSGVSLRAALRGARAAYEASALVKKKSVKLVIDIDPQGMM